MVNVDKIFIRIRICAQSAWTASAWPSLILFSHCGLHVWFGILNLIHLKEATIWFGNCLIHMRQQYGEDGWHARWQDLVMLSVMSVRLVWWLCQAMQSEVATQWIADIYVLCQQLMIWFNMDCREGFGTIAECRYGSTWQVVTKAPMICFDLIWFVLVWYCMYLYGVVMWAIHAVCIAV